jgi:hypothetical protein
MYNVGEMMENNTADGMQTVLQLLPFFKKTSSCPLIPGPVIILMLISE